MKRFLNYLLILIVLLGFSGISLAAGKVKTIQSKITTTDSTEESIGLYLDDKSIEMHTDGDSKITKSGDEIKFTDLIMGDNVEVSYVKMGGFLFLGFGGSYLARTIKVLE